jgi:hypothetical protein
MCRNPGIVNIYNIDNGLINNNQYGSLKAALEIERMDSYERSPTPSPLRIYAIIDRVGSGRVRSMSSESVAEPGGLNVLAEIASTLSDEQLSEVDEMSDHSVHHLEESEDFIPFNINV